MRKVVQITIAAGIILSSAALAVSGVNAQFLPKDAAARVELYPIPTLTLSDRQFLTGSADGTPVTVSGEFRVAQGSGKLPVVVLMHGSSGVGPAMEPWVHTFNAMGISTFVIDGFTGRGLTVVGPNQALLGRLNLIVDIDRSLEILAKHPRVDPDRIVLMGFSRGGQAALLRVWIASTSFGTSPASGSPPTSPSIPTVRPAMPAIPKSRTSRSGSSTARLTIIIRSQAARPMRRG